MVLFYTNNEAYVGQGRSLDLIRLREFSAKDTKWRQHSYAPLQTINNWQSLKVNTFFGSSMGILFGDSNWP